MNRYESLAFGYCKDNYIIVLLLSKYFNHINIWFINNSWWGIKIIALYKFYDRFYSLKWVIKNLNKDY